MDYFRKYLKVAPLSHSLWRSLEAYAISKIDLKSPVLDIGCGFGEFAGVFFDNMIEIGVDIDQKDLALAGQKKRYKSLIFADARNLPFEDKSFNSIISISTLEHIEGVEKVFKEAYRVLKDGGIFVFTVPTSRLNKTLVIPFFFEKLRLLFLKKIYVALFHFSFKHKTIVSKSRWLKWAKEEGFKINTYEGTISKKQIILFEFGLPLALPTQLFRLIFNKRLPISPDFRVSVLYKIFNNILRDVNLTEANIIVVCQKI